ncbi:hypothetical protein TPAR_07715 [Tolypocladium paradoxum]|uniref:Uncharacterized protein n=1 Tax=Tolypocladium paradoxum TaxID=94208 RepID=A0A2S4KPE6_9HYPO|nr:hypothetical protein TPAR_07715 [Tolypocladium paradoxum]
MASSRRSGRCLADQDSQPQVGAIPKPDTKADSKEFDVKDLKKNEEAEQQRQQEQRESEERESEERERERGERQERESRARQAKERAQALRQKAWRRAREREEIEKRDWAAAWVRYSQAWKAIEAGQDALTCHDILWPTKSRMLPNLSEDNVRLFFRKAAPVHLSSEPEEELFRLMSQENKRWHTDKIMSRFGREPLESSLADNINRTSKLLVQLRGKYESHGNVVDDTSLMFMSICLCLLLVQRSSGSAYQL